MVTWCFRPGFATDARPLAGVGALMEVGARIPARGMRKNGEAFGREPRPRLIGGSGQPRAGLLKRRDSVGGATGCLTRPSNDPA
jgi:hypothetical protein